MENQNEIDHFYNQLESLQTFEKLENDAILDGLIKIYSGEIKEGLLAERISINFIISDGNLKPVYSAINKDGKECGFPKLLDLSQSSILYLKNRISITKNPLLLARYYHIIFEKEKDNRFAKEAILNYSKLVELNKNSKRSRFLLEPIEAILRLSERIKYNLKECKSELLSLVNDTSILSHIRFYILKALMNSTMFKMYELKFLIPELIRWIDFENQISYFTNKDILKAGIKISKSNNLSTRRFYEKLALNEDLLLKEHDDDKDFIKLKIYADKLKYYKKSKNIKKFEETANEYERIASFTELDSVSRGLDESDSKNLYYEVEENVKKIISWSSDKIYNFICNDEIIIPDYQKIKNRVEKNENSSFLNSISQSYFDINVNIKDLDESESLKLSIYRSYEISLGYNTILLFIELFKQGFISGKLSFSKFLIYLKNYTWYGQNFPKKFLQKLNDENDEYYNFISVIAPSLYSFLYQVEICVLSNIGFDKLNWILCIDSMTLKFEGALRSFIKLQGSSTLTTKQKKRSKTNDTDIREQTLDELINSKIIKSNFSDNEIALFKMVFTENGANIRNNVAHGFYHYENYSFSKALKVFLCIMRLGKYKMIKKS